MSPSYDNLLEDRIGALGPWQWFLFFFVTISASAPLLQYQQLALMTPGHFCAQPQLQKANWSTDNIRNVSVPAQQHSSYGDFDSCHQYGITIHGNNQTVERKDVIVNYSEVVPCRHGWQYDEEVMTFRHSLPREFNLVCNHKMLLPLVGAAFMLGMIPGPGIAGFLSDRYGRRLVCMVSCLLSGCLAIATAFLSSSVGVVWVFRFLVGFMWSAANVTCYVLCAELTSVLHQNTYDMVYHSLTSSVAEAFYITMAYFLQEWRMLHAVIALPHFLAVFFLWLVPESPRWLLSVGRREEALAVLKRAAQVNRMCRRKPLDEDWEIDGATVDTEINNTIDKLISSERNVVESEVEGYWRILFSKKLYLIRLFCLIFLWIAAANVFYSVSYFSVRLKGNPFIIAAVMSSFTLPIVFTKTILYYNFKGNFLIIAGFSVTFILTAICTLTLYLWPGHFISVIFATISAAAVYFAYILLFTICPRLFPTSTRNLAMGILYGLCRVGSGAATLVERLDTVTGLKWLPMALMASLMCGAIVVSYILPFHDKNNVEIDLELSNLNGSDDESS